MHELTNSSSNATDVPVREVLETLDDALSPSSVAYAMSNTPWRGSCSRPSMPLLLVPLSLQSYLFAAIILTLSVQVHPRSIHPQQTRNDYIADEIYPFSSSPFATSVPRLLLDEDESSSAAHPSLPSGSSHANKDTLNGGADIGKGEAGGSGGTWWLCSRRFAGRDRDFAGLDTRRRDRDRDFTGRDRDRDIAGRDMDYPAGDRERGREDRSPTSTPTRTSKLLSLLIPPLIALTQPSSVPRFEGVVGESTLPSAVEDEPTLLQFLVGEAAEEEQEAVIHYLDETVKEGGVERDNYRGRGFRFRGVEGGKGVPAGVRVLAGGRVMIRSSVGRSEV